MSVVTTRVCNPAGTALALIGGYPHKEDMPFLDVVHCYGDCTNCARILWLARYLTNTDRLNCSTPKATILPNTAQTQNPLPTLLS